LDEIIPVPPFQFILTFFPYFGESTLNITGALRVTGNSALVLQGKDTSAPINDQWVGQGVTINAADIQVEPGSHISADGQGYVASCGPGGAPSGSYGTGGSHGGQGSGNSAQTYGSEICRPCR